jgi:hypothetical protein
MKRLLLLALFVATSAMALPEAARQGNRDGNSGAVAR